MATSVPMSEYNETMLMDILESTLASSSVSVVQVSKQLAEKYGKDETYFKLKTVSSYRSRLMFLAQMVWRYHSMDNYSELEAQWKRGFGRCHFSAQQRQRILEIGSKLPPAPEEKTALMQQQHVHTVDDSSESDSEIQEKEGDLAFMQALKRGGGAPTAAAAAAAVSVPKPKATKYDNDISEEEEVSDEGMDTEEDKLHREYKGARNNPAPLLPPTAVATPKPIQPSTASRTLTSSSSMSALTLLAELDKKTDRVLVRLEHIETEIVRLTARVAAENTKSASVNPS